MGDTAQQTCSQLRDHLQERGWAHGGSFIWIGGGGHEARPTAALTRPTAALTSAGAVGGRVRGGASAQWWGYRVGDGGRWLLAA